MEPFATMGPVGASLAASAGSRLTASTEPATRLARSLLGTVNVSVISDDTDATHSGAFPGGMTQSCGARPCESGCIGTGATSKVPWLGSMETSQAGEPSSCQSAVTACLAVAGGSCVAMVGGGTGGRWRATQIENTATTAADTATVRQNARAPRRLAADADSLSSHPRR